MEGGVAGPGPISRKSRKKAVVIVVVIIVCVVVSSALLFVWSEPKPGSYYWKPWVVKTGDFLNYTVEGERNNLSVIGSGWANFTEVNITEGSGSVGGNFGTEFSSWTGSRVSSCLGDPSEGTYLGWVTINTAFGPKHVSRFISYHSETDINETSVAIVYAGTDSRLIYRVNVSGPSFFLSVNLKNTTVHGVDQLDKDWPGREWNVGIGRPSEPEWTMSYIGGGGNSWGVFDVPKGTVFNYSMEGANGFFYFMDENNINKMEHGGVLESNTTLSLLPGPGNVHGVLEGGVCFVVTDVRGMNITEHFKWSYPA